MFRITSRHGGFRRFPDGLQDVSRTACRTLNDRKKTKPLPVRMRRARLSRGFQLERISTIARAFAESNFQPD